MIKLAIYTALWKRPQITKICFEGIKRLMRYNPAKFHITPVCVVSTLDDAAICEEYGFEFVFTDNLPLGQKWNTGLKYALENITFDYLVQIGSDDLLDSHILESYEKVITAGIHHAGVQDLYFIDPSTRRAIKYRYSTQFLRLIGAGRIFSRAALERSYPLWDNEINKSLDRSSEHQLILSGYPHRIIKTEEPRVIDIKSAMNIWSYDHLMDNGKGEPVAFESAISWVGDKERELIDELCTIPRVA